MVFFVWVCVCFRFLFSFLESDEVGMVFGMRCVSGELIDTVRKGWIFLLYFWGCLRVGDCFFFIW